MLEVVNKSRHSTHSGRLQCYGKKRLKRKPFLYPWRRK